MLVYDLEIVKAIPDKSGACKDGIEYCEGWQDHKNMGISVIGAYDYLEQKYRVFCKDNFAEFQKLVDKSNCLVGFNNIGEKTGLKFLMRIAMIFLSVYG